jgi:integrase
LDQAEPPRSTRHDPSPPTPKQAAAILNAAFASDFAWGVLRWLAMTTGARRGELCALRWDLLDLDGAVLVIRASIGHTGATTWEKSTTHQHRRIALDADTVALLRAYRHRCEQEAATVGSAIASDGRVFSPSLDHSTWVKPNSLTQRYQRMCARLSWDMHLTSSGTTQPLSSSPAGSTCEPWPAGSDTAAAVQRRCAPTRRGSPKPTRSPRVPRVCA